MLEIEPVRRLGKDLSVTKLQTVASSLANEQLATVTDDLAKATENAQLQTTANNLGIKVNINSMSQQEKAMLRTITLLKQSGSAFGDMSRSINAPANQMRIFTQQIEMLKRSIGNTLIPIISKVLPYVIAFLKVTRMIVDTIGKIVGFKLPEFDYSGLQTTSEGFSDNFDDAEKSAKSIKKSLLGFDELNILSDNASTETAVSVGGGLNMDILSKELEEQAKLLDDVFLKNISDNVSGIVDKMKDWLGITDDIDTWAELMETRFGKMIKLAEAVGIAVLAWKITTGFATGVNSLTTFFSNIFGKKGGIAEVVGASGETGTSLIKKVTEGVASVAIIVGSAIALVATIGLLMKIPKFKETLEQGAEGLKIVFTALGEIILPLTAFSAGIVFLSKIPVTEVSLGLANFAIIVGGIPAVVTALGAILSIPKFDEFLDTGLSSLKKTFNVLSEIADSLVTFSLVIVGLGFATPAVVGSGIAGFAIVLGGLTTVLTALGAFKQIPGFDWIVGEGGILLSKLGGILGDFAGSIVGGFLEKVSDSFPKIGTNLSDFMANAKPFIEGITGVTQEVVTSTNRLVGIVLSLTSADIMSSISFWLTGNNSVANFGKDLPQFGANIKGFVDSISGVTQDDVNKATYAAQTIVAIAKNIPDEGGIKAWFTGDNSITKFSGGITVFGQALAEMYTSVSTITFETMDKMISATNGIIDFVKRLKTDVDNSKFKTFIDRLEDFGKTLKALPESKTITIDIEINKTLKSLKELEDYDGGDISFPVTKVPKFANGGYPEDGFFYANHNELVGQFSNGKTAVANNEQITQGIAQAVYEAMTRAGQGNASNKEIVIENVLNVDGNVLYRSTEKAKKRKGGSLITGGAW